MIYNKLIRDRIPEIIEGSGKRCRVRTLTEEKYLEKLREKLGEELQEYLESGEIEELADLTEVIYATAEAQGCSREELERVRAEKRAKRGGFERRLLLEETED